MTWDGYWLPHLVDWGVSVLLGAALIPLLRRMLRKAAEQAGLHAEQAEQAATVATAAQGGAEAAEGRLVRLEAAVGAVLGNTSAALGLRALDDLRFRTIEQHVGIGGRHAAGNDSRD